MPRRLSLPVRPNIENLRKQAKSLLDAFRTGDPEAISAFESLHPRDVSAESARLADAQLVLARSYRYPSWPRMMIAARLCAAVSRDDLETVRDLVTKHPELLTEGARGRGSHWGAAMGFAAELGKTGIVEMLADLGSPEIQHAFGRAILQGNADTVHALVEKGAKVERGVAMGACETLNSRGLQMVLDLGGELCDADGDFSAPAAMVLETYSRSPVGKHECLRILAESGVEFPDTPAMAFHFGRIDLLERHLDRDPELLSRRFRYDDIYPSGFRVGDDTGLHGTPLDGTTLVHMAIEFDEDEIFDWVIDNGADANAVADVDIDGFGGHTPLFNCVVKKGRKEDRMAVVLLERGADPSHRASLRKGLKSTPDEAIREFRDVTPIEYADRFHDRSYVNRAAVEAIEARISTG